MEEGDRQFATFNAIAHLFIPLISKFSISSRSGVATVSGKPEFYQYASVGGSQTLRGYRRDRFWGRTAFYNSNELRWITDFRAKLMTGKFGIVGFIDNGRVWMPNEDSDVWHFGYGGGIMLAPFNRLSASITYGISNENKIFHLRLNKLLF
jgi:hemolysin activation/secretion protein